MNLHVSGVIVTAEEVIEARLGIEEVAAVTEGVGVGDVGGTRGDNAALSVQRGRIAPGVVLILIEQSAGFVYNAYYIPPGCSLYTSNFPTAYPTTESFS